MDVTLIDSAVGQTQEVAHWVASANPATTVPTCPEWTLTDLVGHVGATQRWVTRLVAEEVSDPAEAFAIAWEQAPADSATWPEWLEAGARGVHTALTSAVDGRAVFDPPGGGDGVGFWSTRIFGEISVHRIDAALALSRPYEIETGLAAAAIEDWLGTMASSGWAANVPGFADAMRGHGQTVAWFADDADQAWRLERTEAPLVLTHDRGHADVTIRGPASELLQIVSRRKPLDAAEACSVDGDRHELVHLIDHMIWIGGA